jgi:hypothetical protein
VPNKLPNNQANNLILEEEIRQEAITKMTSYAYPSSAMMIDPIARKNSFSSIYQNSLAPIDTNSGTIFTADQSIKNNINNGEQNDTIGDDEFYYTSIKNLKQKEDNGIFYCVF